MILELGEYKEGADITVMNTFYQYPTRDCDGYKINDFIGIVYKDNKTGKKHHSIIEKPEYTFYKTRDDVDLGRNRLTYRPKEGEYIGYNHLFLEPKDLEEVTCSYNNIDRKIAEVTGQQEIYKENVRYNNRYENKKLHADPNIFFSDMDIKNYYRFLFSQRYTNSINKISKAFFDIEVDTRMMAGDFVEPGECPINAIAYHDEEHDIIISYLLRNPDNPLIEEFEKDYNNGKYSQKYIHDFIQDNIGGWKQMIRYKLDKTKFEVKFFDDELSLLYSFFQQVHIYQPDFIEGWNSSAFDLDYIIARIKVLGAEPADIMCDPSWEIRIVKNYIDKRNKNNPAERGDYTVISGNVVWLDQYIQFASRRKNKIGSFRSFKLDDIAHDVTRVRKLDYHHITNDIAMLPWLNYVIFWLYNMIDVVAQKCIEIKSKDLEYLFAKSIVNNTCYEKTHRQTIYLINRISNVFFKNGFIVGNNSNKWNEKPDKFLGAVVPDPTLTTDDAKIKINGVPIMVCNNLQDYDYKSLYPFTMLEFNIAPNTMIGYINIPEKIFEGENSTMNPKYSRGGEFVENLVCDNILEFCHRWFGLAGIMEFLEDWKEYNERFHISYSRLGYDRDYNYHDGLIYTTPVKDISDTRKSCPLLFDTKPYNPIRIFTPYKERQV